MCRMSVYVRPAAAFKKLEASKLLRHDIYIFGATGFGKTELIKQFFKNEQKSPFLQEGMVHFKLQHTERKALLSAIS